MIVGRGLSVTRALLSGAALSAAFAGWALGAGAHPAAATAPPAGGGWRILPNHSQPGPSIDLFDGSFEVHSGRVTKLTGITQHHVNSGCTPGVRVTMLGGATISHFLSKSIPSDYYYVGKVNGFANVSLTFQDTTGSSNARKLHRGSGELHIYFPGGTDTVGGFTDYSNLTYESATAGTCNLEFSIKAG